jgi:hypothetical protein
MMSVYKEVSMAGVRVEKPKGDEAKKVGVSSILFARCRLPLVLP